MKVCSGIIDPSDLEAKNGPKHVDGDDHSPSISV